MRAPDNAVPVMDYCFFFFFKTLYLKNIFIFIEVCSPVVGRRVDLDKGNIVVLNQDRSSA